MSFPSPELSRSAIWRLIWICPTPLVSVQSGTSRDGRIGRARASRVGDCEFESWRGGGVKPITYQIDNYRFLASIIKIGQELVG